jgi:hypothetical protein
MPLVTVARVTTHFDAISLCVSQPWRVTDSNHCSSVRPDPTTLEWTDGVFTGVLRTIVNNVRSESKKRHWIVFDGDVDPEWAENLNSVLDDNRLLTLPNGERLAIPDNVRLMFEVHSLRHATLATVSRCGMVWFSDDVVSTDMVLKDHFARLRQGVTGPVVSNSGVAVFNTGGSDDAGAGAAAVLSPIKAEHSRGPSNAGPSEMSLDQMVLLRSTTDLSASFLGCHI